MSERAGFPSSIRYSESNIERVYLVGLRLDPMSADPDLYSLVLYYEVARNDKNRPLTNEGRIVFFPDPRFANDVLQMGDPAFRKYNPVQGSVDAVYDVPEVIRLVETEGFDPSATIVSFLNELLDFVEAAGFAMPEDHAKILGAFADHLTFHREYADFLKGEAFGRVRVLDALLWCLGAVLARSKVVRSSR